uniref:Uncharacterized protein n=1 Tax=Anguilla anguilla TaxID=7936 RepID=A0A0E9U9W0_ANGAN
MNTMTKKSKSGKKQCLGKGQKGSLTSP